MVEIELGKSTLPSIINNPFSKTKINDITVVYRDFWGRGEWKATGTVYFENGNTKGQQKFEGETFDDVVRQIKSMIDNLK